MENKRLHNYPYCICHSVTYITATPIYLYKRQRQVLFRHYLCAFCAKLSYNNVLSFIIFNTVLNIITTAFQKGDLIEYC